MVNFCRDQEFPINQNRMTCSIFQPWSLTDNTCNSLLFSWEQQTLSACYAYFPKYQGCKLSVGWLIN